MKLFTIVVVCLLVSLIASDSNDDYDIVRKGNAKWMGFFNSGNALKLADLYVQDAVLVTPGATKFVKGNKQIAAVFNSLYEQKKFTHVELTSLEVTRVNGTLIAELGQYKNQANATGTYYVVWGQNRGNWYIQTDTMIN